VKASSQILCEVGALTELRTFAVSNVKTEHSANLRNAIIKMNHLVHLEIAVLGQKKVLHLEGLCLPPTISWLALEGQLEKTSMPSLVTYKFCAGSFPKLRYLFVHNAPRLNQSVIEEGAMQCLALLVFRDCQELKLLPHGIEHLTGLEELRLEEASEELLNRLQQKGEPNECSEDLIKISHIRKVTVELTKKGISERIR
jgi:disease resistance protein RPM1